jgi:hypothetical protein
VNVLGGGWGGRGPQGDVDHIDLVLHHAKTGDIAYIYNIAIIHSYRDILTGL